MAAVPTTDVTEIICLILLILLPLVNIWGHYFTMNHA